MTLQLGGAPRRVGRGRRPALRLPHASAFTPASIAGLVRWYKADAITGKSDGAAISQWDDYSGNGAHATQPTGTNQPLYIASAGGGKPAVEFDGSNDRLIVPTTGALADWTVVVVSQQNAMGAQGYMVASASAGQGVYENSVGSGASFGVNAGGGNRRELNGTTAHAIKVATRAALYINGTEPSYQSSADPGAMTLVLLGARSDGFAAYKGRLSEVLIFSAALSTANRRALEAHLAAKYGITVS